MKKLGFIALALITVLTTLGVGFAMWSQTVTITGNVNTGNVHLTVSNPTGTWAYKDMDSASEGNTEDVLAWVQGGQLATAQTDGSYLPDPALVTYTNDADWNGEGNDHVLYGSAYVSSFSNTAITLAYNNLFPVPLPSPSGTFQLWCADFNVTNDGSIPVIFKLSPISGISAAPGGQTFYLPGPTALTHGPDVEVSYSTVGASPTAIPSLEGYQLEPGNSVHVQICLSVGEQTVQNHSWTFSLSITGQQWNEYVHP